MRLSLLFVFVHFIGSSLLISTIGYFGIGRLFGPNGAAASLGGLRGSRGRRRGAAQGLFVQPGEKDQLEFGYCFDVRFLLDFSLDAFALTLLALSGLQSRLFPTIPAPLRGAILASPSPHAQPKQFPGYFPRQHPLPLRLNLLHIYHFPGVQCPAFPAQHRASACPDSRFCCALVDQSGRRLGRCHARSKCRGLVLGSLNTSDTIFHTRVHHFTYPSTKVHSHLLVPSLAMH